MNFHKIHDGVADRSKTFELLNRHSGPPWNKPDYVWANEWWEIEESEYDYFLGVLPPMAWKHHGFAMCEFTSGNVTSTFYNIAGRFFHISQIWGPGTLKAGADFLFSKITPATAEAVS